MLLYVSLVLMFGVAAVFEIMQSEKILKVVTSRRTLFFSTAALLPLLVLVILGIFRETSVGVDAKTYFYNYWRRIDDITWNKIFSDFSKDNGFYLLLKLISLITDDWWVARAILFMISFSLYYAVIGTETPYPSVSMIIFLGLGFVGLLFGILRQVIAISLTLLAYKQFGAGLKWKGIAFVLLAVTFHKTSLLFLIAFFLLKLYPQRFSAVKLIVLSGLSFLCFSVVIPFITSIYANSRYASIAASNGGLIRLLFFIIVIFIASYLMNLTDASDDEELGFLFNLSCCTLFVQMGAMQWSLLTRATNFFSVYWCLLIPQLIERLPREKRMLYYLILFVLFGVMYVSVIPDIGTFVLHKF